MHNLLILMLCGVPKIQNITAFEKPKSRFAISIFARISNIDLKFSSSRESLSNVSENFSNETDDGGEPIFPLLNDLFEN